MPTLEELQDCARVVRLPMRVRFRGLVEREVLLLRGPSGWGEFGAFAEYGDEEAARWLAAAVEAGWGSWPGPVRDSVPVNATVPALPAAQVAELLGRYDGADTAKVKVAEPGQSLDEDVDRVAEVVSVLGVERARVRVDANGGWSVDQAREALRRLRSAVGGAVFEYAEQPCATMGELAQLRVALARDGVDVLVAADESVRKAEDPLRVAVAGAADVVVVKVAPLGGVRAGLAVAEQLGAAHGLPVVVSSALDTSVGIAAGVALAAALTELPYACGLGTVELFERDVAVVPLVPAAGRLRVGRVEVSPERLADVTVHGEREAWWRDRLARCHAVVRDLDD